MKKIVIYFVLFSFLILAGGCERIGNSIKRADQWMRDNLW